MNEILMAVAGKSADEIEAMIVASRHAEKVEDPKALAEYLASLAGE